jgi:hypothetical protein
MSVDEIARREELRELRLAIGRIPVTTNDGWRVRGAAIVLAMNAESAVTKGGPDGTVSHSARP